MVVKVEEDGLWVEIFDDATKLIDGAGDECLERAVSCGHCIELFGGEEVIKKFHSG